MKKTILPALAMLIVAAVMLSTASYAWFAISSSVSATNMNVSVKSDSAYMVISDVQGQVNGDAFTQNNIDYDTDGNTELYPVAYKAPAVHSANEYLGDSVWYSKTAVAPGNSAAASTEVASDEYKDFSTVSIRDQYVLYKRLYIGLKAGTDELLNIQATVQHTGPNPLTTLIVVSDGEHKFVGGSSASQIIFPKIVPGTEYVVDVYIYFDGTHTDLFTNNMTTLAGIHGVNVTFAPEPATP